MAEADTIEGATPDQSAYALASTDAPVAEAPALDYRPPMPRDRSAPIGLVGAGGISAAHLEAYKAYGFNVVAICDRHLDRAEARRGAFFPAARATSRVEDVIGDPAIAVVDITLHPDERAPLIERALMADQHVLSQKPFVHDLTVGRSLVELAERRGLQLAVNQNGRWAPHLSYLREAVAAGLVGEVTAVHVSIQWDHGWIAGTRFAAMPYVILEDFSIHWFDFLASVIGDRAERVFGTTAQAVGQNLAAGLLAQAMIAFDGGHASLVFDGNGAFGASDTTTVVGTTGVLRSSGPDLGRQSVALHTAAGVARPALDGHWFREGFAGTMGALLCAIETGIAPIHAARSNLVGLRMCQAACESARTGEPVDLGRREPRASVPSPSRLTRTPSRGSGTAMQPSSDAAGAAREPLRPPLVDAEFDVATSAVRGRRWLIGIGLILIALNLRALFSSLSALLPEAMAGTGAGPFAGSLMTAGPVLCLGLFSFPAANLARRFGAERTILGALATIALGTALRGIPAVPPLLGGGLLAGAGIAICNVLLPGLVKRDFPDRIAPMTGLYSMSLSGGAALAAALTVPFEHLIGSWTAGLAVWALFAVVAALVWLPQARLYPRRPSVSTRPVSLWADGLAWQVSLFMGLQSTLAYCVFGWLAPILRERGLDAASAGYVLSISVVGQMVGCLVAPSLGTLGRDQRAISTALYLVVLAGLWGSFYAPPGSAWLWATVLGLGQGGLLGVALTVILLRAPDAGTAASLSGMAQGVGYTLAASGPFVVGLLRQWAGNFGTVPIFLAVLVGLGIASGFGAGRATFVGSPERNR